MADNTLGLLGIAKKAGKTAVGEAPVDAAVRAGHAQLILTAADAAENSVRRAARFAEKGGVPWIRTPWTRDELGEAVGRTSCAMLALTDAGLAASLTRRLGGPEDSPTDRREKPL